MVKLAKNADKVDGKHAVSASASSARRKGKLVATSPKTAKLPNNIIAKAPDADKLDGVDSKRFARKDALGSKGTLNLGTNLVDWTKLKGVPSELADGDVTGPTAYAHVKR